MSAGRSVRFAGLAYQGYPCPYRNPARSDGGKQSVRLYAGRPLGRWQDPCTPIWRPAATTLQWKGKTHIKDKTFAFRISETDYLLLKSKAAAGQITMTELILRSVTGKKIIVINGLKEVLAELKSIGRNLNQLTTLCNMGRISCLRLDEVKQDFAAALDKILALTGERG